MISEQTSRFGLVLIRMHLRQRKHFFHKHNRGRMFFRPSKSVWSDTVGRLFWSKQFSGRALQKLSRDEAFNRFRENCQAFRQRDLPKLREALASVLR
jgi:hypothetical protein